MGDPQGSEAFAAVLAWTESWKWAEADLEDWSCLHHVGYLAWKE